MYVRLLSKSLINYFLSLNFAFVCGVWEWEEGRLFFFFEKVKNPIVINCTTGSR